MDSSQKVKMSLMTQRSACDKMTRQKWQRRWYLWCSYNYILQLNQLVKLIGIICAESNPSRNQIIPAFLSIKINGRGIEMQSSISRNIVATIALLFSASALADEGSIEVSAGLAWVNGGNVESPVLNAHADNNVTPAITITYYATKNIALSSEAGISRHEFHNAAGSLGKTSMIPANVTAQWHFAPDGNIDPYIGAGFNYCFFTKQTGALGTLKHIDPTLGGVLQVGANVVTGDKWFANIDYKHLWIRPDLVAQSGGKIEQINLDPDIVTLSFGMRF